MNITIASIHRPVTTIMIVLSMVVIGIIASQMLPLEFFPDLDAPFVQVELPYPGSTPEEIERQIMRPTEEVLATISDIKNMYSFANDNTAYITLEFNWGQDTDIKALEAREKLETIRDQMPDDLERMYVRKWSTSDMEIMVLRLSSNRDLSNSYDMLHRNITRRIERLEGVSRVSLYGVEEKEILIQLSVDKLAAHHVDVNNLVEKLMRSNFALTAGRITDGKQRFAVRPIGEFKTLEDYENIIIGDKNLRLKDVADVTFSHPDLNYGRHLDQKYAVGFDVYKEGGANTVEVTDRVVAELEEIKKLPEMEGIALYEMDNAGEGIVSSLNELFKSGMLGALLAVLVLYFFLRNWAATLIVTLAVPVSLLITLSAMFFVGLTLNILSLMGLMLAIGMLVDNAVVATESIHRHQHNHVLNNSSQNDSNNAEPTIKGVKEIAMAITAGTLTTIIVFLPNIVSTSDEVAMWLKHVALTLSIALLASLVLAQTVVPLLAHKFKYKPKVEKTTVIDKGIDYYTKILGWTLKHPKWTFLIIILTLFSIMIPSSLVKFDMFPDQDSDRRLRLFYHVNDNYTVEEVEKAVDVIEDYLYKNKEEFEINSVYTYYEDGYASSTILLHKDDKAHKSQTEIRELIRKNLPKIAIGNPGFDRQSSTGGEDGIQVKLIGKSSEELARLSKEVAWTLSKVPGLKDVHSEAEGGEKEVHVIVDRELSKQYGFSTRQVANVVSAAMRGVRLRKFKKQDGEADVRVEFSEVDSRNLDQLYNLPLFNRDGEMYHLTSLADFEIRKGPQYIRRENRITGMNISANLENITVGEAREKIGKVMNEYNLPAGYSWNYGQRFSYEDEAAKSMLVNMLLALALIYLVMASLFESLIFPVGIWSSILFSIVGVYWFFLMTGTVMSIMGMIGILILIGVVVNNGIVLVDHIIQLRNRGLSRNEAILQAGRERLRPIIMTAATTIFSLLPLTMVTTEIGGSGGPPYFPMARAIVGGLTFSTFVTLLILPTIYVILDNLRNWAIRIVHNASIIKAKRS
jgi:HAE1 family hydrophobic/amphiphilic exporter-1